MKIKWKKRKERGTCEFREIKPEGKFYCGGELFCRMFSGAGVKAETLDGDKFHPNAVKISRGSLWCFIASDIVQPVTIKKVVLRK